MIEKENWKEHILEGITLIQQGCFEKDSTYCSDCPLDKYCLKIGEAPLYWDIEEDE